MNTAALLVAVLAVAFMVGQGHAAGAGRAFPVESENYVTEKFKRINSRIDLDASNFLIDLAGTYANCNSLGRRGKIHVDKTTPDGKTIVGIVDSTVGSGSDVDAVNGYIQTIIDRWTTTHEFDSEIRQAEKFGCSVRPACSGQAVISCLFSQGIQNIAVDCNRYPHHPDCHPLRVDCNRYPHHPDCLHLEEPKPGPKALAFTPQQYRMAERITGTRWDREHSLENLSGQETDCAMIGTRDWPFNAAHSQPGMRVEAQYGWTENKGSTPDALETILKGFKQIRSVRGVGCSVIPDCVVGRQMYVVVSCLYDESFFK